MPKEGNSFQIVLTPTTEKQLPKKLSGKRKTPNGDRFKEPKLQKKTKYERRPPIRSIPHDNGLLQLAEYACQATPYSMQAIFSQEVGAENKLIVQALSSACVFNDALSNIRTVLRKENTKACLKKCLSRPPFNQNQLFSGFSYKPGSSFIKYQNSVGANKNSLESHKTLAKIGNQNVEVDNPEGFVCAGCKRSDTKKYAKNLCQTCYKRQKKSLEGVEEPKGATMNSSLRINEKPEPLPIPNKEWTGTCPDCKR